MKLLVAPLVVLGLLPAVASVDNNGAKPPPPPSIALSPSPRPAGSEVKFLVNVIPATAKYVIYARINLNGLTVDESSMAKVSAGLSATLDQVPAIARQKGANLVVLLSQRHGVPVPIRQAAQPLVLMRQSPVVTLILFVWDAAKGVSQEEKQIQFIAGNPPPMAAITGSRRVPVSIHYSIALKLNTARIDKSYWAYSNISRFLADAVANRFDTIVLKSSDDFVAEDVWLPACDVPIRVSASDPVLDVTIFKRSAAAVVAPR